MARLIFAVEGCEAKGLGAHRADAVGHAGCDTLWDEGSRGRENAWHEQVYVAVCTGYCRAVADGSDHDEGAAR